ncbi:hypothetical protein ACFZCF_28960 [Streptomyces sp. NPDC007945]|uniref:hypothetical protein n=1 Tax=Streptomyces sp. NPDC007945 TaxID=3364797 RepID=UPI0036F16023
MVEVRVGQLRKSRERLSERAEVSVQQGDAATGGLLLFYAAECGLKAEIIDRVYGARDTSKLPTDLRTHDLRRLAKELGLPGGLGDAVRRCRRVKQGTVQGTGRHVQQGTYVGPAELHEAWRYGADLNADDEKTALEALRALVEASRS